MFILKTELDGYAIGEKFEKVKETTGFIILNRLSRKGSVISVNKEAFAECFTEETA